MAKGTNQPWRGWTVLELFVDACLLILFVVQAWLLGCFLTYGYVPIPADWANRQLALRSPEPVRVTVASYAFHFNGRIELRDLEIFADGIELPVLKAERASFLIARKPAGFGLEIRQFFLGDATFILPAVYASDGKRSPVLEKIQLQLVRYRDHWKIPVFAAKHEQFSLRGSIELPPLQPPPSSKELEAGASLDALFKMIATPLKHKNWLGFLKEPTLVFELSLLEDSSAFLFGQLFSAELNHPEASGTKLQIETEFFFKGNELVADEPLRIKTEALSVPRFGFSADSLTAQVAAGQWQSLLDGGLPRIWIAASHLEIDSHHLEGPELHLDLSDLPIVNFFGSSGGLDGAVAFSGQMNADERSGFVSAQGNVDLLSLLPAEIFEHEKMPKLHFPTSPYYRLAVQLKQGLVIEKAELSANSHNFTLADLNFRYIDARVLYENGGVFLKDTWVERDARQAMDLGISFDTLTGEYRVRLDGFAIPYEYNALLPGWWARIFEDFEFSPRSQGRGDFVIYGNSGKSVSDLYFGHAQVNDVTFKGIHASEANLVVRGQGRYVEIHGIEANSSEGWVRGNLSFASRGDSVRGPLSVRYDFDAQMPIKGAGSVFGPTVSEILRDFEIDQAPRIALSGVYFNEAYPEFEGLSAFSLSADSNGPLRFKKLPLDALRFNMEGRPQQTFLRDVDFAYAGGEGAAQIDILTSAETEPELRFILSLKGAKQKVALAKLPDFGNLERTLREASRKDAGTESGSAIIETLNLHAKGFVHDPKSFYGSGHCHLVDENLGAIQLLGPLSVLLRNTWFNFTSFNLKEMKTNFELAGPILQFKDLVIDGEQTKVQITGNLNWVDQSLDMRAAVRLLGNVGGQSSPVRRINDLVSGALPNLLEFHLGGTLQAPSWRSVYDPRNWRPFDVWR